MIDQESTEGAQVPTGRMRAPGSASVRAAFGVDSSPEELAAASGSATETFESVPIGSYLSRQRVLRGVTIEELSAQTRIPLRSLERLERGEFDGETDGFVRGFVRTVARALGLDVDDTISRMLQEPTPSAWERRPSGRRVRQGVALAGIVIVATVGFLIVQAGWRLLVGASADDPGRAVVVWRDPVRALAEDSGEEVDPAGEIDPALGSRAILVEPSAVAAP